MKKILSLFLCVCVAFSLAAASFASYDVNDYIDDFSMYFPVPVREDYADPDSFMDAYDAWVTGLMVYAEEHEKSKAQPAAEDPPKDEPTAPVEATPTKPTESAGASHAVSANHVDASLDTGSDGKYPVGSWVDPAGNVYSSSGELLSPGTTPAAAAPLSDEAPAEPSALSDIPDPDTLAVIAGLVSDIATDQPVWYVEDLRPVDPPVAVLDGLKALVTSVFGEYTPVTTTSVITETVGNDTHQYLVETVAPGAAGVDYEWIAGVFLFGILLFCFMKLLGGVLK